MVSSGDPLTRRAQRTQGEPSALATTNASNECGAHIGIRTHLQAQHAQRVQGGHALPLALDAACCHECSDICISFHMQLLLTLLDLIQLICRSQPLQLGQVYGLAIIRESKHRYNTAQSSPRELAVRAAAGQQGPQWESKHVCGC